MTLIEGVGDEVTQLFIALFVIVVGIAAWCSTNISDQQPLRLLFLSEPQGQLNIQTNSTVNPSSSLNQREAADASDTGQNEHEIVQEDEISLRAAVATVTGGQVDITGESQNIYCDSPQTTSNNIVGLSSPEATDTSSSSENTEVLSESSRAEGPTEVSKLRQRRLAFLQKQGNSLLGSTSSNEDVTAEEADCKDESEGLVRDGIRIRLKYLNDNQKLVQGSLHEPLGDFKRRHFAVELEGNKIVRLVFNGQILQSDSETLQGYGLFDNCVVHCLVHSRHTTSGAESSSINAARDQANAGPNAAYREWDLSHLLYVTLGAVLCIAWYFHYHLSYLFNIASTLALLGFSTAFAISAAATYLPDSEEVRVIN